ncbi:MAG: tetratricopeptide repeat protein [Humidesulfovibrio sp.]|nr:tetratricopeptide repeat protein [Humidesulfovibrio sp.]
MFKRAALFVILSIFLSVLGASAALAAQPVDNSLPFFGGGVKNEAQLETDKKVVAEAIQRAGSREKAVEMVLQNGWAKLKSGDTVTAIKYFNLAWLMSPEDPDVFWGFATAMGREGKFDEALRLFERAKSQKPNDPALLADYGYTWIGKAAMRDKTPAERNDSFEHALSLLKESEAIDPANPMVYTNRAVVHYLQGRYAEAWQSVAKAQKLAPQSVDPRFLHDLSAKMPRPQGL